MVRIVSCQGVRLQRFNYVVHTNDAITKTHVQEVV